MRRIFLINNSPLGSGYGGGRLIREQQKLFFENNNFEVWEISPNFSNELILFSDNKISIRSNKYVLKISRFFQKFNIIEDYLDIWIYKTLSELNLFFKPDDILISLSGGELSSIKLGSLIKKKIGCKHIVNFHDPLLYTSVCGEKLVPTSSRFYQKKRDHLEKKYLRNSDFVITSTKTYANCLIDKYPNLKINYCHFGYIKPFKLSKKKSNKFLNIVYGGSFSEIQYPEIILEAIINFNIDRVKVFLIGDHDKYSRLNKFKIKEYKDTFIFMDQMSHSDYLDFVSKNIDIGFMSLNGPLSNFCVPSKLYEYINLELPVLGVAFGDSNEIIEKNNIGLCSNQDILEISKNISKFKDPNFFKDCKDNVQSIKPSWSMNKKFNKVLRIIDKIDE